MAAFRPHYSNHPAARQAQRIEDSGIRTISIFLGDIQVGTLTQDGAISTFRYNDRARREGLILSHSMRDLDREYVGTEMSLPSFFANLLPEGSRRERLCQSLGIDVNDEFSIYEIMGGEVVGNTRAVSSKSHESELGRISVDDGVAKDVTFTALFEDASNPESTDFDNQSLPGFQNKVSRLLRGLYSDNSKVFTRVLPLVIMKLENPKYRAIVPNEAFFMRLAKTAGMRVATHAHIRDEQGSEALVVERFDRRAVDGTLERIYVEDACQLLGMHPSQKYDVRFTDVARAIRDVVDDPHRAGQELLRALLFSYGIGNGDLHAKNISVWKNPDTGEIELTPAYDILSSQFYHDFDMAIPINDTHKGKTVSSKMLVELGREFELDSAEILEIAGDVSRAVRIGVGRLDEIGFDENNLRKGKKFLRNRVDVIDEVVGRALGEIQQLQASKGGMER